MDQENVELFLKVHCLGVHQEELRIERSASASLLHLDLYWGNRDAVTLAL